MKQQLNRLKCAVIAALTMGLALGAWAKTASFPCAISNMKDYAGTENYSGTAMVYFEPWGGDRVDCGTIAIENGVGNGVAGFEADSDEVYGNFYTASDADFKGNRYVATPIVPHNPDDCITFASAGGFTLSTASADKSWDGALYWSTDKTTWTVWDGTTTLTAAQTGGAGDYHLYLYGNADNTKITGENSDYAWVVTPDSEDGKIACTGNIETLRGATGKNPSPTPMAEACYCCMFYYWKSLTSAPDLSATTLSERCYMHMFDCCESLTKVPSLPATELPAECYSCMFEDCKSLEAPAILDHVTTIGDKACLGMYSGMDYYDEMALKVYYNPEEGYTREWTVTATVEDESWSENMFGNTGSSEVETPVIGETYYIKDEQIEYVAPVYVTEGDPANGIAYWTTNSVSAFTVVESSASAVTWGTSGATSWYVVKDADVQIDGGVTCAGHVNLILCEGAKLVVTNVASGKAGIATDPVGSFTVYGQPDGAGELAVYAGNWAAGIGGGSYADGKYITINGGRVKAVGGFYGAGIGGGDRGGGSHIAINGGVVTASCAIGGMAACIGGGNDDAVSSDIVLNAGKVYLANPQWSELDEINQGPFIGADVDDGRVSGVIVSKDVDVLFNMTGKFRCTSGLGPDIGIWTEPQADMPADFKGLVLLVPDTLASYGVGGRFYLANGLGAWNAATTFAITNAQTGATDEIDIGEKLSFASTYTRLFREDDALIFTLELPELWIDQQPDVTNGYAVVARTDGNKGITNYIWSIKSEAALGAEALVDRAYESKYGEVEDNTIKCYVNTTYGEYYVDLLWLVEGNTYSLPGIPPDGELHFTCPLDFSKSYDTNYGVLTRGEGTDEWVWTPIWVDTEGTRVTEFYVGSEKEAFELKNVQWVYTGYTPVAEGADLTAFPVGSGVAGETYQCELVYAHYNTTCLGESEPFTFLGSVGAIPTPVERTTWAVYTNGFLSVDDDGVWAAWTNETATVVYTAEDGYVFADGSAAVTNTFDTSKNPATADAPAAPTKPAVKYLAPVYVDGVASNGIAYWTTNTVETFTVVESSASAVTLGESGATSWYVVKGADVQIDGGVTCQGHVNLILCEGAKLTVDNVDDEIAGIATDASGSFTVYGQPDGAGELAVFSGQHGAGIGGGRGVFASGITINGGTVTATSEGNGAGIGGGDNGTGSYITINGGTVTATCGVDGAGIGGGFQGVGSHITINGGTVTARAVGEGSGIGCGSRGASSYITINGGTVTATSGANGAGIGCGWNGSASNIAINGGMVTANGGDEGAGIGGGSGVSASGITINGGTVTATGGENGAGIGGGHGGSGFDVNINGGTVTATGGLYGAGIGGGLGGAGSDITINGGTVTAISGSGGAGIGGGVEGVGRNIEIGQAKVFVCGPVDVYNLYGFYLIHEYYPDAIGCGGSCTSAAEGVVISPLAKICFNLTGFRNDPGSGATWTDEIAPMPEDIDGFVVMTPEVPVERVLVGGYAVGGGTPTLPAFALTNAVTGATRPICVGGGTILGDAKLKLTHADETLSLLTAEGIQVGDAAWAEIADGLCTVYGTGDMWSYDKAGDSPLWDSRSAITNLVVSDGVTGVGSRFFENMWWLRDVSWGASVTNVGERAFKKCYGLTNVVSTASGAAAIGDYVFSGCHSLQAMTFANTPTFGTESYSLQAAIYMEGDIPRIYPIPQLKVGEQANALRIKGKQKLGDADWTDVTEMADEERKTYHFFKVVMP